MSNPAIAGAVAVLGVVTDTGQEYGSLAIMAVIVVGLLKTVDLLINKFVRSASSFSDKDRVKLDQLITAAQTIIQQNTNLAEAHAPVDEDGVKLWYVPRSWNVIQKDILEVQRSIAETQRETVRIVAAVQKRQEETNKVLSTLATTRS